MVGRCAKQVAVLYLIPQILTCPNASFTDLAEIVSRIEPATAATVDGELVAQVVGLHNRGWPADTVWDRLELAEPQHPTGLHPCPQVVTHTPASTSQGAQLASRVSPQ